jgi:MerR family transcriptional regulator, repressor of the yfmOP operon
MDARTRQAGPVLPADAAAGDSEEQLIGIGAAAERAGVSQRALRYYQQIGLLTPRGCTPGGLRRYCEEDLARVARIRQLQTLLGLNLDEIALVLRGEDRMAEIRLAYHDEGTTCAERRELVRESLELQHALRTTVEAKRQGIEGFLTDLDARIGKTRALLDQMTGSSASPAHGSRRKRDS